MTLVVIKTFIPFKAQNKTSLVATPSEIRSILSDGFSDVEYTDYRPQSMLCLPAAVDRSI